jgi:DNA protecting protein DprA
MTTDEVAILELMLTRGLGTQTMRKVLRNAFAHGPSLGEIASLSPRDLDRQGILKIELADALAMTREPAARLAEKLEQHDIRTLAIGMDEYPRRLLATLNDAAPPVLFVRGNLELLDRPAVAFGGSRKASPHGLSITTDVATMLSGYGVNVVSGYANGVDLAAHRSALESGGATTLVLAEGILQFRPKSDIADLLAGDTFLILSEFPPDLRWIARNAMQRNSTIIGLADALLIVESGREGGTFAAGEEALRRRCPLFVVKFSNPPESAAGNDVFLARGAHPIVRDRTSGKPNLVELLSILDRRAAAPHNPPTDHHPTPSVPDAATEPGSVVLFSEEAAYSLSPSSSVVNPQQPPDGPAMTTDRPRLIEVAFPLKQASLDSVREKYGPRGHITGFHLWPARRPLAAARAALIETLLPDPGTPEARRKLVERIGGRVVKGKDGKETTEGGILRWGRESNPDLQWFRDEIRKAYGGRAPRVLDPFAGGGAIPFEAMRLGCEVTAVDINPVAWFILKCTLEYPQRLAGQTRHLPDFVRQDRDFLTAFFKARGAKGKALAAQVERVMQGAGATAQLTGMESPDTLPEADLAWHVRAWGAWVLERARRDLAPYYPTVDAKPTVAYLWARTVTCKQCRATIPLLKTRWLCKKDAKRVVLTMMPNSERTGVVFGIQTDVPAGEGSKARKQAHDKTLGGGTMSRSGAACPCCGAIMTMEDLRLEGLAGHLGAAMTAVVSERKGGRTYRLPTSEETDMVTAARGMVAQTFGNLPYGLPSESTPSSAGTGNHSSSMRIYGFNQWANLFTSRQLLALGKFAENIRLARGAMSEVGYPSVWLEAIELFLATALDRLADHSSTLATWYLPGENVKHTFVRYALQIVWDFAEANPLFEGGGSWASAILFSSAALDHTLVSSLNAPLPRIVHDSATKVEQAAAFDVVMTDPPYYGAIMYSDIMDYFYVWLRRTLHGHSTEVDAAFSTQLAPKWDLDKNFGELIDDPQRFGGDKEKSRAIYEDGMEQVFQASYRALAPDGRLVIVFAHKHPDAWESLVSAIVRAGFLVDGSWPIQTENATRSRAHASAALSSSVWLVCRKRAATARPGWDNLVLGAMRDNIIARLHDFWDAGIRGPDFVWAATGPALEAYSQYPAVKKANAPGEVMPVSEFLAHARRLVVEFVVGRVLSGAGGEDDARDLDPVTTYYLLHRHDFGMEKAPVGPCILYAVSCGLRDSDLTGRYDLLSRGGATSAATEEEDEEGEDAEGDGERESEESGGGATVKLKAWNARKRVGLAADGAGRPVPLIDRAHRIMQLWRLGDVAAVNTYLDAHGLRHSALFHHLLQALIELAPVGSEERSLLESISNHINARAARAAAEQPVLLGGEEG